MRATVLFRIKNCQTLFREGISNKKQISNKNEEYNFTEMSKPKLIKTTFVKTPKRIKRPRIRVFL
ncbi:hypothetical protein D3C87_1674790 [compost metagenome]